MYIILMVIWDLFNLYVKKFRCLDVLMFINIMFILVFDILLIKFRELYYMMCKQVIIVVCSGLNDDEQYGCVVLLIYFFSIYNFIGFNELCVYDYLCCGNLMCDVVQCVLVELEGGVGVVFINIGMLVIYLVIIVFLKFGDLLVVLYDCYGGSYCLFDSLVKCGCYCVLFVD